MGRDLTDAQAESSTSLYESDFYSWTQQQAELLRSGRLQSIDVANLLEEIETMGRSERASLKSAYRLICSHLLKMKYQPTKYTRSWYNTVDRERAEVVEVLAENPGLRPAREEIFAKAYALGRRDAARETAIALRSFPEKAPFTVVECDDASFIPKELRDHLAEKKLLGGGSGGGKGD